DDQSGADPMTPTSPLDLENGPVGAAEGCDLLILLFDGPKRPKIKRSQPSAAPTGVGEGLR
ncbi:hypothetical protein, partial [Pseudomonas fluorescens]|uniref:hypothetical protein n=1 Tax=Pseudomonas fluorescens TaxID=294 RepID=UPI001BB13D99